MLKFAAEKSNAGKILCVGADAKINARAFINRRKVRGAHSRRFEVLIQDASRHYSRIFISLAL